MNVLGQQNWKLDKTGIITPLLLFHFNQMPVAICQRVSVFLMFRDYPPCCLSDILADMSSQLRGLFPPIVSQGKETGG